MSKEPCASRVEDKRSFIGGVPRVKFSGVSGIALALATTFLLPASSWASSGNLSEKVVEPSTSNQRRTIQLGDGTSLDNDSNEPAYPAPAPQPEPVQPPSSSSSLEPQTTAPTMAPTPSPQPAPRPAPSPRTSASNDSTNSDDEKFVEGPELMEMEEDGVTYLESAEWLYRDDMHRLNSRRNTAGALIGIGAVLSLIGTGMAGLGARETEMGGRGTFTFDASDVSLDSSANGGRGIGGLGLGIAGGVFGGIGGWMLSSTVLPIGEPNGFVHRLKYRERRRDLRIAGGVFLGVSGALALGMIGSMALGFQNWNDVPSDSTLTPSETQSALDTAKFFNYTVFFGAALPYTLGMGIGLFAGENSRRHRRLVYSPMHLRQGGGLQIGGQF